MSTKPIIVVQGGQYGSEGKGMITGYLCKTRRADYCVRTGATNAGHTVIYKGQPVKLQQLPVGFVNPNTVLVIGAGALIDPEILAREVALLSDITGTDIKDRLYIDHRAGVHDRSHQMRSKGSDRHHLIGATGKGCSEALIDRIKGRGVGYTQFGASEHAQGYRLTNTENALNDAYDAGAQIVLEGTQGTLLDLYLGPYPYTTHKQTGPGQWMLEAGLSPALQTEIVSVIRTFPIRVAGNSGPMPQETSWPILARQMNAQRASYGLSPLVREESIQAFEMALKVAISETIYPVPAGSDGNDQHTWGDRRAYRSALSELNTDAWKLLPLDAAADLAGLFEMTTVTKKLRRIACLDLGELAVSARQSRPHWVAMTFMNYAEPHNWFITDADRGNFEISTVTEVENASRSPVKLLSYGPADEHAIER